MARLSSLSSFPWYRQLVRPLLFRLPPEAALRVADVALAVRPVWRAYGRQLGGAANVLERTVAGVPLRNPIGLAAGLDKQCAYLDSLGDLGFGYVVGGTITRHPRPGNPKPRVLRLPERESLVNSLGFPSDGLDAVVARLRRRSSGPAPVFVSIAALEEEDTEECLTALEPLVSGVEVNISSPNTQGLRRFQESQALRALLERLNARRTKPLFVKLPPYADDASREQVLQLLGACVAAGVSGVTAINTVPVEEPRLAMGRGGLSGRAVLDDMLGIIPELRREAGPEMIINACGGIATSGDVRRALDAGADTVQLYTAMVYGGPGIAGAICRGLALPPAAES